MSIRNSGTPHSPPPDLLSFVPLQTPSPPLYNNTYNPTFSPPEEAIMTGEHHHQAAPHVMVSRINPRLFSSINADEADDSKDTIFIDDGSPFAQDESTTDQSCSMSSTDESFGHGTCVQTSASSSVSSSLSYNGRWREEERAIPLKKRRILMASCDCEANQSKEMKEEEKKKKDEGEMEGKGYNYKRCNRKDGKGWRCSQMRVEGFSLCKHHLEMRSGKMKQKTNSPKSRNQIKKEVKARSISSLLRDTAPLLR